MEPAADHGERSYRGAGKLEGRRALITGGDSGIGRAVAIAYAREGADVAIAYYDEEEDARETLRWVREAGRTGVARAVDLADPGACAQLVEWAVAELGGLDLLVNNAAYQCEVEFEELQGHGTLVDYAATKGAIHTFTKSLAQALADRGIRVNCVAPGPVWTPLIPATLDREHVGRFGEDTLHGRPAQPAEVAPSYVFLASDDGRYYSGEVFAPTGRAASR